MPTALHEPDPQTRPLNHRLWLWQKHNEEEHGATESDYKRNVKGWHRRHHPDCDFTPPPLGQRAESPR